MDELLKIAINELGVKETVGPEDNPVIVNYASESGFDWVDDDETPWCSIFLNWCASKAGLERSKKANARSWLVTGIKIEQPEPGDIVVLWRKSINSVFGHVGIFTGYSNAGDRVYLIGGNQGNQVSITAFPSDRILGFRRLRVNRPVTIPDVELKRDSVGDAVKSLQDALKEAGFECGTTDGFFGVKTETAVRALQSTTDDLSIDGIFTHETRNYLLNLLNA